MSGPQQVLRQRETDISKAYESDPHANLSASCISKLQEKLYAAGCPAASRGGAIISHLDWNRFAVA
jgi:hypothetical protein